MSTVAVRDTMFRVAEIFGPTIQGEGALLGMPTVFVRLGGCDYRCSWCDSIHAVLPSYKSEWRRMDSRDILLQVATLAGSKALVTLSGGNPALYNCQPLLDAGHKAGYTFACETQGSMWPKWLRGLDHLVVSPKPPSSGHEVNLERMAMELRLLTNGGGYRVGRTGAISVKVVVMDEADLAFAGQVRALFDRWPLYLSVGNPHPPGLDQAIDMDTMLATLLNRYVWLSNEVLTRGWYDVRVTPQMHVLAHGNRRGV